ncbi:unnamed protein product [Mycena citricolor]|uniref:Uncharacterized protein n=1 Tax=Mycena citricolor TaxID=2018698 RepID=A0AAD2H9Q0_9AGAR|nr:unnamed protein product [Mycena citricolor]
MSRSTLSRGRSLSFSRSISISSSSLSGLSRTFVSFVSTTRRRTSYPECRFFRCRWDGWASLIPRRTMRLLCARSGSTPELAIIAKICNAMWASNVFFRPFHTECMNATVS